MAITSCELGTGSVIEVDITSMAMTSASVVGGRITGNLTIEDDMPDATNNDDAGSTSAKYGNRTVRSTFNVRYDYVGDAAQIMLADTKIAKSEALWIAVSPRDATAGMNVATFKALIENFEITHDNGALVDMNVTVRSNGPVTWDTGPA